MPVEDVFSIEGRGTVVTGRIERGTVKINKKIEIVGIKATAKRPSSLVSKCSTKQLDEGMVRSDNAGAFTPWFKERRRMHAGQVRANRQYHASHRIRIRSIYSFKRKAGRHTPVL